MLIGLTVQLLNYAKLDRAKRIRLSYTHRLTVTVMICVCYILAPLTSFLLGTWLLYALLVITTIDFNECAPLLIMAVPILPGKSYSLWFYWRHQKPAACLLERYATEYLFWSSNLRCGSLGLWFFKFPFKHFMLHLSQGKLLVIMMSWCPISLLSLMLLLTER